MLPNAPLLVSNYPLIHRFFPNKQVHMIVMLISHVFVNTKLYLRKAILIVTPGLWGRAGAQSFLLCSSIYAEKEEKNIVYNARRSFRGTAFLTLSGKAGKKIRCWNETKVLWGWSYGFNYVPSGCVILHVRIPAYIQLAEPKFLIAQRC